MREIKFRAWHKVDNFMLEPKYIKHLDWNDETIYYIGGNYALYEYDNIDNVNYFWKGDKFVDKHETVCDVYFSDIELMQYTGLKDKNGIEIYEGDIMKLKESKEKYELRYLGNRFVLCKYDNIVFEDEAYFSEREVVGNIYENPELLKD